MSDQELMADPTGASDAIDVEQLLSNIDSTGNAQGAEENPPHASDYDLEDKPAQEAPADASPEEALEFLLNVEGKEVKADRDQVVKYAQQGYHYAQKMAELNQQSEQANEQFGLYKQIDDYAKGNPDWWNTVVESYNQNQNGVANNAEANDNSVQAQGIESPDVSRQLEERIKPIEEYLQVQQAEKQRQEQEQAAEALEQEVKGIREEYSTLDWDAQDGLGYNLEQQVLKHAENKGMNSFKAAFRDLLHDKIVEVEKIKAREEAVREVQDRQKKGLLPKSLGSSQGNVTTNVKLKSYNDLESEALDELAQGMW
jgi:hypothetical protein